jgi:hypothetical protein
VNPTATHLQMMYNKGFTSSVNILGVNKLHGDAGFHHSQQQGTLGGHQPLCWQLRCIDGQMSAFLLPGKGKVPISFQITLVVQLSLSLQHFQSCLAEV